MNSRIRLQGSLFSVAGDKIGDVHRREEHSLKMGTAIWGISIISAILVPCTPLSAQPFTTEIRMEWNHSFFGTFIGERGIFVVDLDGDDRHEIVSGGSWRSRNDYWFVLAEHDPDQFRKTWMSELFAFPDGNITRMTTGDANADGIPEIYVATSDGMVHIYDGASLRKEAIIDVGWQANALVVADVDMDGIAELTACGRFFIHVFSLATFQREWSMDGFVDYDCSDLVVGDVDLDESPEIITTANYGSGYVIDGTSKETEWEYTDGFGFRLGIGDVDGDGISEFIGLYRWYNITAFNAEQQTVEWTIETSSDHSALLVQDTNFDGIPEVLVGNQSGPLECYDSTDQSPMWSLPYAGTTNMALGDANRDGTLDIVWGWGANTTGPDFIGVADIGTGQVTWRSIHQQGSLSAVDVGDVDGDGDLEIVLATDLYGSTYGGIIMIFDAETHAYESFGSLYQGIGTIGPAMDVKIGDVDDDGDQEIVIATGHTGGGTYEVYDGSTHVLEQVGPLYYGSVLYSLAIGDVDRDGQTEIVAGQKRRHTGADGTRVVVVDGATAQEEWRSDDMTTSWTMWMGVYDIELSDIDSDGNTEIIASVEESAVYAWDGVTHQTKWESETPALALKVSDIDRNGVLELLLGDLSGNVNYYNGQFELISSFRISDLPIKSIEVFDVDDDGVDELLFSDGDTLYLYQNSLGLLLGEYAVEGYYSYLGYNNNIVCMNTDSDANIEIIIGNYFRLVQLELNRSEVCDGLDNDGDGETDEECDDGISCTYGDTCGGGGCAGTAYTCDDGNICTDDICNGDNTCLHIHNRSECDDGNACTDSDICQSGVCEGPSVSCDDGNVCTDDICEGEGICVHVDNSENCDDADNCTHSDTCVVGTCIGTPYSCDDGEVCTADICNGDGTCSNTNQPVACSDGNACTLSDYCGYGTCIGRQEVVCTPLSECHDVGVCDPNTGECSNPLKPNGASCDHGEFCTVGGSCQGGNCLGSEPRDCSGSITEPQCQTPRCNEDEDLCFAEPANDGEACDDSVYCSVSDACSDGICKVTELLDCSWVVTDPQCQVPLCDEGARRCVAGPHNEGLGCDDGNYCSVGDVCRFGSCIGSSRVCSEVVDESGCQVIICDEGLDQCVTEPANEGFGCNDGEYCTVGEQCRSGVCTGGVERDCSRAVTWERCQVAHCREGSDSCFVSSVNEGGRCSDKKFCTVGERCRDGICTGGEPLDCSGVVTEPQCQVGRCDDMRGHCVADAVNEGMPCKINDHCKDKATCLNGRCVEGRNVCDVQGGGCGCGVNRDGGIMFFFLSIFMLCLRRSSS